MNQDDISGEKKLDLNMGLEQEFQKQVRGLQVLECNHDASHIGHLRLDWPHFKHQ